MILLTCAEQNMFLFHFMKNHEILRSINCFFNGFLKQLINSEKKIKIACNLNDKFFKSRLSLLAS